MSPRDRTRRKRRPVRLENFGAHGIALGTLPQVGGLDDLELEEPRHENAKDYEHGDGENRHSPLHHRFTSVSEPPGLAKPPDHGRNPLAVMGNALRPLSSSPSFAAMNRTAATIGVTKIALSTI